MDRPGLPDHGLAIGSDVDNDALRRMCASGEIADMIWEAPDDFTASHRSVFDTALTAWNAGQQEAADWSWQQLGTLWSHAWAASYSALELMQGTGLSRFSPLKPQRWVVASFEHHTSPHGLPHPHVHNLVITCLTTGPGDDSRSSLQPSGAKKPLRPQHRRGYLADSLRRGPDSLP